MTVTSFLATCTFSVLLTCPPTTAGFLVKEHSAVALGLLRAFELPALGRLLVPKAGGGAKLPLKAHYVYVCSSTGVDFICLTAIPW